MSADLQILVVDDVEQNLVAMRALLARPGLRVLAANSGPAALEILLKEEVALALIDVQMPGMDGFELAELVRGSPRTRGIPLIFVTASASDPRRTFRGYEAGVVDFLHKPVETHVLQSKVAVFVELHAQRRQLSDQLAELRDALRTNELFTMVLGHDLRNPLATVLMSAEVLVRQAPDERTKTVAERIRTSSRRMANLVNQLLDAARLRSGRLELRPVEGDLHAIGSAVVEEFRHTPAGSRVALESGGDLRGIFDPDRISQVLSNLVGNALDHGEAESPVVVALDGSDAAFLIVRVRNRGSISDAVSSRMFEPFQGREPDERSTGKGLGLGLHIVSQFVRAHGGTVQAKAQGEDTVFEVRFPRRSRAADVPLATGTDPG